MNVKKVMLTITVEAPCQSEAVRILEQQLCVLEKATSGNLTADHGTLTWNASEIKGLV